MAITTVVFYACAVSALFCALRVVTSRHIFHSALYLAGALASLAVLYLLLHAEFVAVVQLLVYVGAVIILVIFAVMLTAQIGDANIPQTNRLALPAALAVAAAFVLLQGALLAAPWDKAAAAGGGDAGGVQSNLQAVGLALLGDYVYPFELAALILFTALVGAVLIARKDPE